MRQPRNVNTPESNARLVRESAVARQALSRKRDKEAATVPRATVKNAAKERFTARSAQAASGHQAALQANQSAVASRMQEAPPPPSGGNKQRKAAIAASGSGLSQRRKKARREKALKAKKT